MIRNKLDDLLKYNSLLKLIKINFFLCVLMLMYSCNQKREENQELALALKIDTLLIDSNNKIIYLKDDLLLSTLMMDSSILYNFNYELSKLEKINLKKGILERIIHLEKEGPNGIGDFHSSLVSNDDSLLVFKGLNDFYFLNRNGDFLKKLRLGHLFFEGEELQGKSIFSGFYASNNLFYLIIQDWNTNEVNLLFYNLREDKYELFEIPELELSNSGSVVIKIVKSLFNMRPRFSIDQMYDGIAVSNKSYPLIFYYANKVKTHQIINPPSKFYNDVTPVESVPEVYGEEEGMKFMADLEKRMNFLPPIWDEGSNKILRWGYKRSSEYKFVDVPEYDNYLFVIDSAFNMEKEYHFPQIRIKPRKIFLADNKIFLYNNFEDELGFIRVWLDNL